MDPFTKLPAEIILMILESCYDFTSLDGLQQISPRVEQVFNTSYTTVTEHVLKNCSLTSEVLQNHFTLLASIESTTFTPAALLEQLDYLSGDVVQPVSISTIKSLAAVRQAVSAAAKVHLTACACLQHIFNRLQSAKPRRPIAPTADIVRWVNGSWLHERNPEPKGEIFQFVVDPPSWIETHRAHRGLWNLELFCHIYNAASTRWSWSTHDLDCFAEEYVKPGLLEEIRTMSECVSDLCPTQPTILNPRFPFLIAVPLPTDLTLRTCWPLPMVPTDTDVDSRWGRRRSTAKFGNNVLSYYHMLRGLEGYHRILWKVDFRAFRRLGIPLWDRWRLYQMRLQHQSQSVLSPEGNLVGGGESDRIERPKWVIIYTWYSLAEDEDLPEEYRK
ncbi:hypothetical protein N7460_010482 [Penicillium canescens]|uniref:F-box domain-containing protein n=1 Tax=Penicillium canescens TaxID=5083 RepID=A0AAD6I4L6_PENCN|nr:hypothetical protein N7460_010482 [Penicillium canescens]KAJ6060591.1 hypothetical protein N7444_002445 [Penicillium canescens]